jgi:hypothetical protein
MTLSVFPDFSIRAGTAPAGNASISIMMVEAA